MKEPLKQQDIVHKNSTHAIIADPDGASWAFAQQVHALLYQRAPSYALIGMRFSDFRDGEMKPQILENIRGKNCFFIHDSQLPAADWFTRLVLGCATLYTSDAREVTAVLPYLRFARQDRKDAPRVPISSRVIADAVQPYIARAISVDIHNPAIQGFYRIPFENLHTFLLVAAYLKKKHAEILQNMVIMSPDAGGAGRARKFAQCIGSEDVVIGYKVRKTAGEVAAFRLLGDVSGKQVLIIDDIIDSGGTLIAACKRAREMGATKVYAYATHGLFTKGIEQFQAFDKVFVSDSLYNDYKHPLLSVIPLAPLFAEAIHRITQGESISALFEGTAWLIEE